ncbi:MAG TPA: UbiA family prenyltransferase [Kineosporiaceae bacterium]|nr:UbiA family prenyltransferase [Kineosporiaceae bacterium]
MRTARALLIACHPLPSVTVTGFITAYALTAGITPARALLLAAAVLTGQLSIGWCNDAVDADRDVAAGRADKPIAAAAVDRRTVGVAAGLALLACAPLSLALGVAAGTIHLIAVASAWAYDLWLKSTLASGVPYLVSFGLLPAVATQALPDAGRPGTSVVLGAALLGLAAHFANTVADTAADAATGVRGLPQRIGPRACMVVTAALVALAAVMLLAGAPRRGPAGVAVLGLGAALAGAGAVLGARVVDAGRTAFRITLAAVALVIAGFLLTG